jgi:membrane protein
VPPNLAETINPIIDQAIAQRNTVAGFGLLTALYSGIGWMTNLREALSEQWAQVPDPPALPKRLLFDLLALLGLGTALVGSFAITGVASAFAADVLEFVGLGDQGWAQFLLRLLGIGLGLVANFGVFLWLIARLPRQHTPVRSAVKAAVLGAVGFEILKQVMTVYLTSVTNSPSGAVFGSLLGLLVFVNFVSRFVLFVTAWAATAPGAEKEAPAAVPAPAVIRPEVVVRSGPNGATTAGLLGAGALTALLGLRAFGRRR